MGASVSRENVRAMAIAAAVGSASAGTGCSLIAELADQSFEVAVDGGSDDGRDATSFVDATVEDGAAEDARADAAAPDRDAAPDAEPPGAWVPDPTFPPVLYHPTDIDENFAVAVSPTKIWLVGTGSTSTPEQIVAVSFDKDSGAPTRADHAQTSTDQVIVGAVTRDEDLYIAAAGNGDQDSTQAIALYKYTAADGGVEVRNESTLAAPGDSFQTPGPLVSVDGDETVTMVSPPPGTDSNGAPALFDFLADGGVRTFPFSAGFGPSLADVYATAVVDGGTWFTASVDNGSATSNGAFFATDDGSVPNDAGNFVFPTTAQTIAQATAGNLLMGGFNNEDLYFSPVPSTAAAPPIGTNDEITGVVLTADPSNPTGFLAIVTLTASPASLQIVSLDANGSPLHGTLASSSSQRAVLSPDAGVVATAADVTLSNAVADGPFLYAAFGIGTGGSASYWVLQRFAYDATAAR